MSLGRLIQIQSPKSFLLNISVGCGLALALFVLGCIPASAAEQPARHSLENYLKRLGYEPIPLKRDHGNHLYVYGELEGKSRSIGVDTGCSMTVVDSSVARKLKTLGKLGVQLDDSVLGTVTRTNMYVMSIKIGSAMFTNQPAWSRTLDAGGQYVGDCLLGCDFFFRNFCLIDCTGQKLYVRATEPPPQAEEALGESLRRSGFHELKLGSASRLMMTVSGKANSEPIQLLLDTGAPWTQLDARQTGRLHIEKDLTTRQVAGIGKAGTAWIDRTRLKSFDLGELSFANIDVGVVDLSGWKIGERGHRFSDVDGLLGADFLADHRALIDCHNRKLWLQP
jgi:predicted aspartyl protease